MRWHRTDAKGPVWPHLRSEVFTFKGCLFTSHHGRLQEGSRATSAPTEGRSLFVQSTPSQHIHSISLRGTKCKFQFPRLLLDIKVHQFVPRNPINVLPQGALTLKVVSSCPQNLLLEQTSTVHKQIFKVKDKTAIKTVWISFSRVLHSHYNLAAR